MNSRILAVALMLGGATVPLAATTNGTGSGGNAALAARVSAYVASLNTTSTATLIMTPSFARQTGLACSACHTHYPELTATGRAFKLNGYVFRRGAGDSIQGRNAEGDQNMLLGQVAPLSFMVQTSYTATKTGIPNTQNGTIFFPDQLSVFTGGEISQHMGGFLQLTFDPQSGSLGIDNADFRYANNTTLFGRHTVFGLSLNNNPTVQDLWNSTPAWGFPYGSSSAAPTPGAVALIDGQLGQQVAGLTAYTMFGDHLYAELGAYHSAPVGIERPVAFDSTINGVIKDFAPYWRVALPFDLGDQYLTLGTYGMSAKLYNTTDLAGEADRVTDVALDLSYMVPFGSNNFTVDGTWIHETQHRPLGGSANVDNTLNTLRATAMYHLDHSWAFTVAPFTTTGTADLQLYQAGDITGFSGNSPNSTGLIGEVDVMPWQNVRFQFQYIAYSKFNGASSNYDGAGRNASDNNTLYALLWLLF